MYFYIYDNFAYQQKTAVNAISTVVAAELTQNKLIKANSQMINLYGEPWVISLSNNLF